MSRRRRVGKKQASLSAQAGPRLVQQAIVTGVREKFADALRSHQAGNWRGAEQLYREILLLDSRHVDALHLLGVVAYQLGRIDEAVGLIGEAIMLVCDEPTFYSNLGLAFRAQGKLEEAEASFERALSYKPDYAEAHSNLGVVLQDQGRLEEAAASLEKAIIYKPDYAEAHSNFGLVLLGQGKLEVAVTSFERALQCKPDYAEAYYNLGHAMQRQGNLEQAAALYRTAITYKANYAEAYGNLGSVLQRQGKLAKAILSYGQALFHEPGHAQTHSNLGFAFQSQGKLDEAKTHYQKALSLQPEFAEAHSNFLFCLTHDETVSAESMFFEHCRFSDQFELALQKDWPVHCNSRDPDRPLQIGFVSGDFYDHPVSRLILPILEALISNRKYVTHAYNNNCIEDHVTQNLRNSMKHWNDVSNLTDSALAEKIRADQIDILIDLSGHTARNRLLTFARKPAPVQVSWVGYPATTGLHAIDYYLADRHLAPIGTIDRCFREKIVRMPAVCRFQPHVDSPPTNQLPALRNEFFTFGSLNRNSKLGNAVIDLWCRVLNSVANSRMIVGGIVEEESEKDFLGKFAQRGIGPQRITFYNRMGMLDYLRLHHEIDLMLDTFPYSGGTTSGHAVFMGVPVLTLVREGLASRQTASLLYPTGLGAFVAESEDEFATKAVYWTRNMNELNQIRTGLRAKIAASPLMKVPFIARGLEKALRIMWQRWCDGLTVESFEIT